jgi:hypothetical protein
MYKDYRLAAVKHMKNPVEELEKIIDMLSVYLLLSV